MLLRFCVCRGEPFGTSSLAVFAKFCSSGSLEEFPPDEALHPFCFPLTAEVTAPKRLDTHEEYSFTMTGGTGERIHAFCRRVHPLSPSGARYPVVLCMMSEGLWGTMLWKVLEVVEQLLSQQNLLANDATERLSPNSSASWFLRFLGLQLSSTPRPGQILRIPFPTLSSSLDIAPQTRIAALGESNDLLQCTEKFIELQVPPLMGGDFSSAGVSISSLVWRIPVPCLMTLIAGLLLERRILLVSRRKDVLSSAIHAASILMYPFKWHHVYLPIVPESLKEYVMAPMPFLIGIPAQLVASLRGLQMSEVTIVDLDLGKCEPKPGSDGDDAQILPMRAKLEEAIRGAVAKLRTPQEFEGNHIISGIMTDYFVKLFKGYRRFIKEFPTDMGIGSKPQRFKSNSNKHDTMCGEHHYFDFPAFVQSRGKSEIRQFMMLFRQSQMFEVMIQDRLELGGQWDALKEDCFERKISLVESHESRGMGTLRKPVRSLSKTLSFKRNKRRLMVSTSDTGRHGFHPDMVSVLASSALRQAVSDEYSTIRLSSSAVQPPEASLSAMDSMASSNNSGWQSDIESLADKQMNETSGTLEETESESTSVLLEPNLICLEDPHETCSITSTLHGQLDENPFGEPDAFPQSIQENIGVCVNVEGDFANSGAFTFSDSETWDERTQSGAGILQIGTDFKAIPELQLEQSPAEAALEDSCGTVSTESVCWNQLIDGLADNENADASQEYERNNFSLTKYSKAAERGASPFIDASDDLGPMIDLEVPQAKTPALSKRMSRVQALRIKSQKHLEEMFASNLRIFDSSASAAAHPGSVPWILPRSTNCNVPSTARMAGKGIQ